MEELNRNLKKRIKTENKESKPEETN